SRIIAFSANPQAMSVYGGDVGLDEFAKHPNPRLLWETAQARVTWNYDLAIWSSHDGEDTLFNEFAQEARAACSAGVHAGELERRPATCCCKPAKAPVTPPPPAHEERASETSASIANQKSKIKNPPSPWNIYFRVTLPDAIQLGLVDTINRARGTHITPAQFLADCRARARNEEIFEQSYMCNPRGTASNHIVEWSAIERCRADYEFDRMHLEAAEVRKRFGEFNRYHADHRQDQIGDFLKAAFRGMFGHKKAANRTDGTHEHKRFRLGFDVAASGQGDLAAIYVDEAKGDELWLRGLFTCRTEDWHFIKTVLFHFL